MNGKKPIWERLGTSLKMGLQFCPEAEWLPHDDIFGNSHSRVQQIALKNKLFDEVLGDVFAAIDLGDDASQECWELITAYAQDYLDISLPARGDLHPLEAAARSIPEDLAIISPVMTAGATEPDWVLSAGAIAFPAHWVLTDKIAKPMSAVHAAVPDYDKRLETPVNRFFNNMKSGPISCRFNWSLQIDQNLYTPQRSARPSSDNATKIDDIFVRIERQTLRKLPKSGHILFTIRTNLESLGDWVGVEGALASLGQMLEDLPDAQRHYKGASLYLDAIRRAAGIPAARK